MPRVLVAVAEHVGDDGRRVVQDELAQDTAPGPEEIDAHPQRSLSQGGGCQRA